MNLVQYSLRPQSKKNNCKKSKPSVACQVMNATQKAQIHSRLLEERERIVAEWKNHGGGTGPGEGWDLRDLEERAVQITSQAVETQIVEDDRNLLSKIDFALQRLDAGTYGQCDHCGAAIPLERLMAKPSVSLCLACQQAKDALKA
ncbi:MAG: hypothetical protein EHM17_15930 [Verrucomicrobiaceae bacterium]|nr:MAG: hypothetical protein EHM17_15930 [Verrucomicrobiaceae bacterium]